MAKIVKIVVMRFFVPQIYAREITWDIRKTMSDVGKIMSDIIQITSDLFSLLANI